MEPPAAASISGPGSVSLADGANEPEQKPLLRGISHLVAFFVALAAGPTLVALADTTSERVTASIYSVSLAAMFGCSALLHRVNWSPRWVPWFRRLDHSTIFLFIAGTYTPMVVLGLPEGTARLILVTVWLGAAAGIAIAIFWIDAPRWVAAGSYVAVGWVALLAIPSLWNALTIGQFVLLVGGGVLYTLGSVVYARKQPDPSPLVFGFHELFHALVVAAVVLHYVLILNLVRR